MLTEKTYWIANVALGWANIAKTAQKHKASSIVEFTTERQPWHFRKTRKFLRAYFVRKWQSSHKTSQEGSKIVAWVMGPIDGSILPF